MLTPTSYSWSTLWPEGESSPEWSHSGIEVLPDGRVVFCAPGGGDLVVVSADGSTTAFLPTGLLEIHGISLDPQPPVSLWLADPGEKPRPGSGYDTERRPGRVLRMSFDGTPPFEIAQPARDEYRGACWRPTSVVADDDGGVWVADGYGASLVHKFDRAGRLLLTVSGAETGRHFDCPHGLLVDRRAPEHRLVVADRGNRRLVFYRMDGSLQSIVDDPMITSPSCLAALGDRIVFTELFGGVLALGPEDEVSAVVEVPGRPRDAAWPNAVVEGRLARPAVQARRLNSPHGIATGADGSIYLTEWMIGGRQLRLLPAGRA